MSSVEARIKRIQTIVGVLLERYGPVTVTEKVGLLFLKDLEQIRKDYTRANKTFDIDAFERDTEDHINNFIYRRSQRSQRDQSEVLTLKEELEDLASQITYLHSTLPIDQ